MKKDTPHVKQSKGKDGPFASDVIIAMTDERDSSVVHDTMGKLCAA